MQELKELFAQGAERTSTTFRNACIGGVAAIGSGSAFAEVDVAGVTTAITDAEAKGGTVGTAVIVAVASLVVVGVIIAIVKKI